MFKKILTSSLLFLIAIGGFFVSIEDSGITSTSYTNATTGIGGVGSDPSVISPTSTKPSETESKWLNEAIQAVNALLGVLTVIVSPAIILAGWLMSPDWTSGDLFGLREPMHKMWVIVSNIVYFIYAILLIIIALATIFGKDNFNYKVMLPRLALGILMVPFTWWFVQWTISIATVVTASVINIPMDTMKDQFPDNNNLLNKPLIPRNHTITTLAGGTGSTTTSSKCNEDNGCITINDLLKSDGGIYNTLLIYAYNVFKIQDYKSIDSTIGKISTAGQLLSNVVVGAIMLLVFGLLVMALIGMLLLRAIKLWMYAIFSPIFTLHFVAGKELFGKGTDGFDIKEFIGLCFVPAVVGLTLSFGLMIVSIVQLPSTENSSAKNSCTTEIMLTLSKGSNGTYSGGCVMARLMGTTSNTIRRGILLGEDKKDDDESIITDVISIAGMNIVFRGLSTNIGKSVETANTVNGAFSTAGGIFGTIIIDIIALVFIWMAFMAAKGVSKAVEVAVQPFEDMGKKVGQMAMSAPKYIPIPGTGGQSAASLQRTVELGSSKLQEMKNQDANDKAGKLVPWAVNGIIKPEDETKIRTALRDGNKASMEEPLNEIRRALSKADDRKPNIEKTMGWIKETYDSRHKNDTELKEELKKLGIDITSEAGKSIIKIAKGDTTTENEQRVAYNALKGASGNGGSTTNNSTINNISSGTNVQSAVKILMDGNNNGTITKRDLQEKLEGIYKESPNKDKIIQEIISELEKDKTKFKFKTESSGGGSTTP